MKLPAAILPLELSANFFKGRTVQQKTHQELLNRIKELEDECSQLRHENMNAGFGDNHLRELLDNIPAPIYLKDADFNYISINRKYEELAHVKLEGVIGKSDFHIFPQPVAALFRSQDEEVIKKGTPLEFEETIPLPDGIHTYITSKFPLYENSGNLSAVGGFCTDITGRKKAEEELNKHRDLLEEMVMQRTKELGQKSLRLEESNIALKVLLRQREDDKVNIEDNVLQNIEKLVLPYLEKIKGRMIDFEEFAFIEAIELNLKEITAPFNSNHSKDLSKLTPAEIQIVDLVKKNKTTKEIARLLKLSPKTIASHRQNIRKKLDLTNTKTNLRTVLLTNQK